MILPESPSALTIDGALTAWAVWVVTVGAPAIITVGTAVIVVLRVMILLRKWREHK